MAKTGEMLATVFQFLQINKKVLAKFLNCHRSRNGGYFPRPLLFHRGKLYHLFWGPLKGWQFCGTPQIKPSLSTFLVGTNSYRGQDNATKNRFSFSKKRKESSLISIGCSRMLIIRENEGWRPRFLLPTLNFGMVQQERKTRLSMRIKDFEIHFEYIFQR